MKLYGEIHKTEEQDDGTIKVWGYASSETVDSDGTIVTADAMKAALPDYMKFGAVREMHDSKKAAGTAIEAEVQDDGKTYFGAHVVDSEAVKKVQAGVYKGFSIGGKITGRDELNKSIVTGVRLVEVSLVDRPANPEAVITIMKAEEIEEPPASETAPAAEDAAKVEGGEHDLKKYAGENIMDARSAISCLSDIMRLFFDEASEAEKNTDQIANLKAVIDNLKAFIASEIQEADPDLDAAASVAGQAGNTLAMAAETDDLEKSGKEISNKNLEKVQAIHDHAVSMGAECAKCDGGEKADKGDDIAKMEDLQKAHDDLQKRFDEQAETITKQAAEIEALKAEPEAPKAAVRAITKAEDGGGSEQEPVVKNDDGSDNDVAAMIKKIHQSGGVY